MKKIISLCMVIILALSMIPNGTIYGENYAGLNLQSLEGECNFTNLNMDETMYQNKDIMKLLQMESYI